MYIYDIVQVSVWWEGIGMYRIRVLIDHLYIVLYYVIELYFNDKSSSSVFRKFWIKFGAHVLASPSSREALLDFSFLVELIFRSM